MTGCSSGYERPWGDLMSEWPLVSLADLAAPTPNSLATGPFGSSVGARYFRTSGVPLIRGSNLSVDVGRRLLDEQVVYLDLEKAAEFQRSQAVRGDLVFTCWGTIGQVGLIDGRARFDRYIVSNKQMKLTPDPARVDPLFLYYALSSPRMIAAVQAIAIGSSVPGFNLNQLRQVAVALPSPREQRAIAEVLGALDDKIEANQNLCSIIGGLARAKVVAAQAVAEHAVPLGNLVRRVTDIARPDELEAGVVYVGLEHIPRGSLFLTEWGSAEGLASAKARFQPGDILFGKLRPYFKKVVIAPSAGVCSTDVLVLRPRHSQQSALTLIVCSSDEVINYASSGSHGTRMPRVSWDYLSAWQCPMPDEDTVQTIQQRVEPMLQQAVHLTHESILLAQLRDALLPKLLSGELRVRDAEALVEEAV